jgi:hypothetical protein
MLSRVRRAVIDATERRQVPWDHSSLTGDFYFHPLAALQEEEPQPVPSATEAGSRPGPDVVVWSVLQGSTNANDFKIFLEKYPESPFVPFARSRLAALTAQPETGPPPVAREASIEAPQAAFESQHAVRKQVAGASAPEAVSEPSGSPANRRGPSDWSVAALASPRANRFVLARSSSMGLEISVEHDGASWCSPELRLRIEAGDPTVFSSVGMPGFLDKLAKVIEAECSAARRAAIVGFASSGSTPVYESTLSLTPD